jgi:uncharacterized protein (TIGR00369 family)
MTEQQVRESFRRQAFMIHLGAEMTRVAPGEVEIELAPRPDFLQQNGYVHAGVVTSILDSACGYAAYTLMEDGDVLSVEFKVNLVAPASGERIRARASVKRAGKRLTVCTADAFSLSGGREMLVACMQATIMRMA